MASNSPEPIVAGLNPAQWGKQGVSIGPPIGEAAFSAEQARETALKRFPSCTDPVATLVQMDIQPSQVVHSTTCWAISVTPGPGISFLGGPAGRHTARPVPAHLVVFLEAQSGRMVITRIWS